MRMRDAARRQSSARAYLAAALATTALCTAAPAIAQTFTPIHPPAAPLITRQPYLNVWLKNNTGILPGTWPQFWDSNTNGVGSDVKAITGIAMIDGKPFLFLGAPALTPSIPNMTQTSLKTTATQSIFTLTAGGVNLTVDFLSPVEATDLQRLSIPLSDISATVQSADGATHSVSVYFDISAEWASGNETAYVNWKPEAISLGRGGGTLTSWTVKPTHPSVFTQDGNFADWGTVLWATQTNNGVTIQSGQDVVVRSQFQTNGVLANTEDENQPRAIDNEYPVFAFAKSFGTVGTKASAPFTLLLGRVQQQAVNYLNTPQPSLWTQYFASYEKMLAFAYNDVAAAFKRANTLDTSIYNASAAIGGTDYAALTALSLRQAFAATELTGTKKNPYLFLEEISSDDNVQTVDVLYPSMPAFLYTNPELVRYLLEPVIDYVESGQWPKEYSPHDLGQTFPNASGHNDGGGENMPVEETANMLIMADAYMQRVSPAEAATWANAHYTTFRNWANYLQETPAGTPWVSGQPYPNALDPQFQNQTDDFAGDIAHSVNLALKGISGVAAFGQIAAMAGNSADAATYANDARTEIGIWQTLSQNTAGTHLLLTYREPANTYAAAAPPADSYGITSSPSTLDEADSAYSIKYNSFPDRLLGLNLVPASILAEEAAFYKTIGHPTGTVLESNLDGTPTDFLKADWEIWTAAGIGDQALATQLIGEVYTYANTTQQGVPFSDLYNLQDQYTGFEARPVVGGVFAPLLLGNR